MITPVQATNVDDDIKVQKNGKKIGENMLKCQIKGTEKNVGRRSRIGAGPSMAILLLFGAGAMVMPSIFTIPEAYASSR